MRSFRKIIINDKALSSLQNGHPWIYGEEVVGRDEDIADGEIVDVYSRKNRYCGSGFFNSASKILVRVLSANANEKFDNAFFERRVKYAVDYRLTVMNGDLSCTRLIFGDSDTLPGLIVDKFSDVLVAQVMTLGIEQRKEIIFDALIKYLRSLGEKISVLYERGDVAVRAKEGLPQFKGFYHGEGLETETCGTVEITENGIKYNVDYINGQKTGYFLDQKFNRLAAASIAANRTVLDCFTHTGAFGLNCAKAGAKSVTSVDISAEAIENSKKNAALNGIENIDFLCCDVFELLTRLVNEKSRKYNYIILDPPAFTKSSSTVKQAYKGYKDINLRAMRLLPRGGYLATCSCSHFMTDGLFRKMLTEAANDAGVSLQLVEYRQQAKDHPVLMGVPETEYLKFYIFRVI